MPGDELSPGAQPLALPEPAVASPAPSTTRWNVGLTLLMVVIVTGAGCAFLLPTIREAQRAGKVVSDVSNLKQLWTMQSNYAAQFGGPNKLMPTATGSSFWLALARTNPPLIEPSLGDVFDCPLSPAVGSTTHCEYRGPASDVNFYGDGDPVGACDHGEEGIVVIRKSGDATFYPRNDPVALAALEKTRP